jgi:hypothetical protein
VREFRGFGQLCEDPIFFLCAGFLGEDGVYDDAKLRVCGREGRDGEWVEGAEGGEGFGVFIDEGLDG